MRFSQFFALALAILGLSPCFAEPLPERAIIPCTPGAHAFVELSDGAPHFDAGLVAAVPTSSRWPSFTATKWGIPGTVCASAVNAIHLLVSKEQGKGRTISILPEHTVAPAAGESSFVSIRSPAGTGLFGGYAPPTGSRVSIRSASGRVAPLGPETVPAKGDIIVIEYVEAEHPYLVDIENRPGGRIIAWDSKGPSIIARVLRPLAGVGRFGGTQFQGIGRIRANHPGVIDVCTSLRGDIGGFQILPFTHSKSSEMVSAWDMTQWLIVAPESRTSLEGHAPLFLGSLIPGAQLSDRLPTLLGTYGRRPLVLCRIDGGSWRKLPNSTGRNDSALNRVTHLRIYFPEPAPE
jgi:hypothetical protein